MNIAHKFAVLLPDKLFLKLKYRKEFGRALDLKMPKTFNEKLQWIKLYDRKTEYTTMVDKLAAKDYVSAVIGSRYIIPTLAVYSDPEEIDFDSLPESFVLKCNHNSGLGMYVCQSRAELDARKVRTALSKGLKENYYLSVGREWPYKNVPKKILAEKYMASEDGGLTDYKVHCFNGIPKFILVCQDRFKETGLTEDFFTTDWEHMAVKRPKIPNASKEIPRPEELEEMLNLAARLSRNIPFVRVDFYIIKHRIYFSELTFFPTSGFGSFEPDKWDKTFGDWLTLPEGSRL